jgi:hypothetical protein
MKLEDMLLKPEEIVLEPNNNKGYHYIFLVPIHPRLIEDKSLKFEQQLAYDVLNPAAEKWYEEMKKVEKTTADENDREVIRELVLSEKLKVNTNYPKHSVEPPGDWELRVSFDDRGFAYSFCTETDIGGTLTWTGAIRDSWLTHFFHGYLNFSEEKLKEYTPERVRTNLKDIKPEQFKFSASGFAYSPHNTDSIIAAYFLRQWVIAYHNECLKQVFKK